MRIQDFPQFARFHENRAVKVLRHKSSRWDLWGLRNDGKFTAYQNDQSWDVFGNAQYIISFIAEHYKYAKFVGVWEVKSKRQKSRGFRYTTRELPGFEDLEGRLVVSWGDGTRSWAQWLHRQGNKEVMELLPPDYVMDFPGFYNFTLDYNQMKKIVDHPDAHREWQRMLRSVSGIYLLIDKQSGMQYVGSASGSGGIWGRWRSYARSQHGGNVRLKELLKRYPNRYKKFQFSILRVLEPHATKDEVLEQETLTKHKLGSRAFGLNVN